MQAGDVELVSSCIAFLPDHKGIQAAWNRIKTELSVVQKPSHNSDYAAAIKVANQFIEEEGMKSYIGSFIRYCENRLHSSTNVTKSRRSSLSPTNSPMDTIAALADKWCDSTNQPDNICIALYQFTTWACHRHL